MHDLIIEIVSCVEQKDGSIGCLLGVYLEDYVMFCTPLNTAE